MPDTQAKTDEEKKTQRSAVNLPYVMATGRIKPTFEQIIKASVPDRFTQDFLTTKLGIKGGSGKAMLPFLKKIGFVNSDGTPTDIYKDFRIDSTRGRAMAEAIIDGYAILREMNEYFYDLGDKELKDLVVRATGAKPESSTVAAIINTVKALKEYAAFDTDVIESTKDEVFKAPKAEDEEHKETTTPKTAPRSRGFEDIKLGYTINLNLPASSDISVYNAIFKSLKENIFDE
ncbi:MAG TPA: DUF5343 domain-containing protein [Patescibacteria group bacterium]|nr:DUF5343 domain-containing protein [Patescibacteria group bacterium]